jgi:hypothetical protein
MIEKFQLPFIYATARRFYELIGFLFKQGTATEKLNRYQVGKVDRGN